MDQETKEHFEQLTALIADAFSNLRDEIEKVREDVAFVGRKLDNRFDLLERMMTTNRAQDVERIAILETSIQRLISLRIEVPPSLPMAGEGASASFLNRCAALGEGGSIASTDGLRVVK